MPVTVRKKPRQQRLWRYFTKDKFTKLINDQSLWFSKPSGFDDKNEGLLSQDMILLKYYAEDIISVKAWLEYDKEQRDLYGVSCWHSNKYQSLLMWDLYVGKKLMVQQL